MFHSCAVMGHAAEPPAVLRTHPCDLQNPGGQKSVPTREEDPVSNPGSLIYARQLLGSNLASPVSTGRLSFSQLMTGSGRPWIWHWNRATPDSSACTDSGWTWKFAMAAEGGREGGRGTVSHYLTAQLVAWLLTPHVHIYRRDTENPPPPSFILSFTALSIICRDGK